ncbi:hypothetical protein MKW92_025694 [Papaver armeniacum]|nr:hypothetical protein MKW92_025694 [Papaver armeniacum]
MAYIPPHKRQSKDGDNIPVPTPSLLEHQFQRRLNLRSSSGSESSTRVYNARKVGIMIYAKDAISKWFIQGGSVRMEPFRRSESFEWKRWGDAFVLTCDPSSCSGSPQVQSTPWVSIADNIRDELLDSFGNVREEIRSGEIGEEPGKYFSGGVATREDAQSCFGHVGRSFCTNLPDSYMESILDTVVPKIGVESHQTKKYYHVKVFDKCNPNTSISIKCRVISGQLKMHKIELNQKRCLVVDVSCLEKDLDLRLMLSTKRGLVTSVKGDAEKLTSLRQLVDCAILDSNAKGDGRYSVIGVWHTNVQTFKTSQLKLRLRNADRFDFWASDGDVSNEVTLEVTGINASLIIGLDVVEMEDTIAILEETLKLVWDHFLSCDL